MNLLKGVVLLILKRETSEKMTSSLVDSYRVPPVKLPRKCLLWIIFIL